MRIAVLGPLEVRAADGSPVDVRGGRLRALLVRLALDAGRPVGTDTLLADLWGDDPPVAAANALQSLVSRLRTTLRPTPVRSGPAGYTLHIDPSEVDALEFERLTRDARRDPDLFSEALRLWRGEPLADVRDAPFADATAARLTELRLTAIEDQAEAAIHTETVVRDLEAVAAEHPLRERTHELLIRALHAAGRQTDAAAVYERFRNRLADELGLDPSTRLRELHVAVLRGEPVRRDAGTPQPSSRPGSTNLRARLTSFVGRDDDMTVLARLLDRHRLVTLTGPGGAGKTRLATETARRLRTAHDGLWMIELAPLGDPADVAPAVLSTLGASEVVVENVGKTRVPTTRAAKDRLADVIGTRDITLLMDNCEHLIESIADLVETLVGNCPGLRICATSREPLGVPGEVLHPVGPLDLPPSADDPAVEYPAIRLFVDRAKAVRPDFAVTADNASAVTDICRRLDGMPLAIELAAARIRALSPAQISERLSDRFRLLTTGSRTAMPRHQTLRAVVDWSWDLLTEPERATARRLSVFSGGATLEAVERVCDGDVLDLLASLVDKSLVEAVDDHPVRYRMLETVKAFSAERLAEAGEPETVRRRHAAYFVDLATQAAPKLRSGDQLAWIARLDADHDNLLGALRFAIDTQDAATAVRLVAVLSEYWTLRGRPAEGLALSAAALELPGPAPAPEKVSALLMYAIGLLSTGGTGQELGPELEAPEVAGRIVEGEPLPWFIRRGLRSLALIRLLGRRGLAGSASAAVRFANGMWSMIRRDEMAALREFEAAFDDPDPWYRSLARMSRAMFAENAGLADQMYADLAEALDGFRSLGDRWGMSLALRGLGSYYNQSGDFAAAEEAQTEALRLIDELGTREGVPMLLTHRAETRAELGDLDGARADLNTAIEMARQVGSPGSEAVALTGLSGIARIDGDLDTSRRLGEDALAMMEGLAAERIAPQGTAMLTANLARVAAAQRLPDEARAFYSRALELAMLADDMPVLADVVEAGAETERVAGDPSRAAFLLGIAACLRSLRTTARCEVRRTVEELHGILGPAAYQSAYEKGAQLTRDAALAELTHVRRR